MDDELYDVSNCPLVFPRLCCELIKYGISLHVTGKMGGDYQLNGYLTKYFINPDQDLDNIPDIVYYSKTNGQWFEIFTFGATLDCGKQGNFQYSRKLTTFATKPTTLRILLDYLRLNSSASIECLDLTVVNTVG